MILKKAKLMNQILKFTFGWFLLLVSFSVVAGCGSSLKEVSAIKKSQTSDKSKTATSGSQAVEANKGDASQHETGEERNSENETSTSTQEKVGTVLTSKIKFKDSKGNQAFAIKPTADGAKLVGPKDSELARYSFKGSKLKIKDDKDQVLGYLKWDSKRIRLFDSKQENEVYRLELRSDGDWKIEKNSKLIGRLKKRSYGWEVESEKDKTISKIKLKNGKTSIRDSSEKTVFSTKSKTSTMVTSAIGFLQEKDLRLRVGFALVLMKIEREMK